MGSRHGIKIAVIVRQHVVQSRHLLLYQYRETHLILWSSQKFILAEQEMELAERSAALERENGYGEVTKELVCVLVAGMLMAVE